MWVAGEGRLRITADTQRLRPEKSEVERLLADNTLARTLLLWEPRYSLEEGLAKTIEWMQAHRDQYQPDVYTV